MYPYMCIAGCSIEIVIYDESYHMQKKKDEKNGSWIAQFTGKSQKHRLVPVKQQADRAVMFLEGAKSIATAPGR